MFSCDPTPRQQTHTSNTQHVAVHITHTWTGVVLCLFGCCRSLHSHLNPSMFVSGVINWHWHSGLLGPFRYPSMILVYTHTHTQAAQTQVHAAAVRCRCCLSSLTNTHTHTHTHWTFHTYPPSSLRSVRRAADRSSWPPTDRTGGRRRSAGFKTDCDPAHPSAPDPWPPSWPLRHLRKLLHDMRTTCCHAPSSPMPKTLHTHVLQIKVQLMQTETGRMCCSLSAVPSLL